MFRGYPVAVAMLLMLATGSCTAQSLYRSVNERGEVTFSDSPPEHALEVQEVEIEPGPSPERQRESAERARQIEALANDLGEANAAREQQRIEARDQAQQRAQPDTEQPAVIYTDGRDYPVRPVYPPVVRPPVRPELPVLPRPPVRPVPLPAGPAGGPGR